MEDRAQGTCPHGDLAGEITRLRDEMARLTAEKPRWTKRFGPVVACDHAELEDAYAAAHGRITELETDRDGLRSLAAEILGDFWPEDLRENASEGLRDQQARVDGYRERARVDSDGNLLQPGGGNEAQPAPAADVSTRALAYAEDREADEIAVEDDAVSVDIGSNEDGDYDDCEPTL